MRESGYRQHYQNQDRHGKASARRSEAQVNMFSIVFTMLRNLKMFWFRILLFVALVTGGFTAYRYYTFTPSYQASFTVAVSLGIGKSEMDIMLASGAGSGLPIIIMSDDFQERMNNAVHEEDEDHPHVDIKATIMENTNFVKVKFTSVDPDRANLVMDFVLNNLEGLINIALGNIQYTIIEKNPILPGATSTFSMPRNIIIGAAISIAIVVLILYLLAVMDDAVHSFEEVRSRLGISQIGGIPALRVKRRKKVNYSVMSVTNKRVSQDYKEAYYQLRARIEKEMHDHQWKVLLVTSSVPGEGKTTTCANLAASMAERGEKVLLIDGDLRKPTIGSAMNNNDFRYSIVDVLEDRVSLPEAIVKSGRNRPDFLGGKVAISEPGRYIASGQMKRLIDEAAEVYDYVIIDTPPSAMLMDASVFATYADTAVYIIRQNYTRVSSIEEGMNLLGGTGIDLLGCIMNCVDKSTGYGKYSNYNYGKKKGSTYKRAD